MKAALLGDPILGTCTHNHGPVVVTATITGNIDSASPNVRMEGIPVARLADTTAEHDCHHSTHGSLIVASPTVRANGKPIAHALQSTITHGDACALSGGGTSTVNIA